MRNRIVSCPPMLLHTQHTPTCVHTHTVVDNAEGVKTPTQHGQVGRLHHLKVKTEQLRQQQRGQC